MVTGTPWQLPPLYGPPGATRRASDAQAQASFQIAASEDGHRDAVRWARELGSERVWAIEDCRHVSRRLEQALLAGGKRVVRVPPKMMGASRRAERQAGKSDEIDALAVARAVVKDGSERSPPPIWMSARWRSGCSQTTAIS